MHKNTLSSTKLAIYNTNTDTLMRFTAGGYSPTIFIFNTQEVKYSSAPEASCFRPLYDVSATVQQI